MDNTEGITSPMVEADRMALALPVVELTSQEVIGGTDEVKQDAVVEASCPVLEESISEQKDIEPAEEKPADTANSTNGTNTATTTDLNEPRSMRTRKPPAEPTPVRKRRRPNTKDTTTPTTPTTPSEDSKPTQTPSTEEPDSNSGKRRMLPRRPGISWVVGAKLEAMDYLKNWYPARVVEVDEPEHEVLIHFDRWNARFDEWLEMKSDRLRAIGSQFGGTISAGPAKSADAGKPISLPQVCLPKIHQGSIVLAKWKSGRFSRRYPAKVKRVKSKTLIDIEFYDGMECEVLWDTVQKLPSSLQKQALHIWSLMSEINDAEDMSPDQKRSRRDVMEAKKNLQDKIDEAEGRLTRLIDSATSLIAKVGSCPDKKVSNTHQRQLDTKPAVKTTGAEAAKQTTHDKPKTSKSSTAKVSHTTSPEASVGSKQKKNVTPPKVYTSKQAKGKEKGKLVVAGLFKNKTLKPTPSKTEQSLPTPDVKIKSSIETTSNPKSVAVTATTDITKESSSSDQGFADIKPHSDAQPTTVTEIKDVKLPVIGVAEIKLPITDVSEMKAYETPALDVKPPVADVRDMKSPVVDVREMKSPVVNIRDVKSPVASIMDVPSVSPTSSAETIVSAVHVCDSILSRNMAPVVELEMSSSSTLESRLTRKRRHSSEKSQPPQPDVPIGYAMVLESVNAKPAKAFVVEEDHNQFKCPHCSKSFRKDGLLQAHVRHYHDTEGRYKRGGRKRKKTLSHCSSDSEAITPNSTMSATPLASPVPHTPIPTTHNKPTRIPAPPPQATVRMAAGNSLLTVGSPPDTDYYMDVATDEEEVDEEDSGSYQSEVVNCVCGFNEEDGLMIQCELCCCWQHAECFHIDQEEQPGRYLCYICTDTPGIRQSSRYMHNQEWYRKGALPKLDFLMSISSDGSRRQGIIKESHKHLLQLHTTINSLKSMGQLIDSAQKCDMYELALWSPADYPTPSEGESALTNAEHSSESSLEQRNLIRHIDSMQKEMEEQLLAIDRSVTELENDAGVSSCTSADQLTASSNVLKRLMDDISKVQKLTSLTRTTPDPR